MVVNERAFSFAYAILQNKYPDESDLRIRLHDAFKSSNLTHLMTFARTANVEDKETVLMAAMDFADILGDENATTRVINLANILDLSDSYKEFV